MEINFKCPQCEASLTVAGSCASMRAACPRCSSEIQIPAQQEETPGVSRGRVSKAAAFFSAMLGIVFAFGTVGVFSLGIYRFFELPVYDHLLVPFYALVFAALVICFRMFHSFWRLVCRKLFPAGMLLLITVLSFAFSAVFAVFVTAIILRIFGTPDEYSQHLVPFYILIFLAGFSSFLFTMTLGRLAYELKKFLRVRISLFKFLSLLKRQMRILDIFVLGKK